MKKIFLVLFCVLFTIFTPVYAEIENVIYSNSFLGATDGLTASFNTSQNGGFDIRTMESKKVLAVSMGMSYTNNDRSMACLMGDDSMSDYTLTFEMRGKQTISSDALVFFNVNSGSEYYCLRIYPNRTMKLCKNSLSAEVKADTLPSNTRLYLWNNYMIKSKNGVIEIYVNDFDNPIIVYEEEGAILTGKVGFGVFGAVYSPAEIYVANVRVTKDNQKIVYDTSNVISGKTSFLLNSPFMLNGTDIKKIDEYNPNVVPYLKNDNTMIPLRALSEAVGFEVSWENDEIRLTRDGKLMVLKPESDICTLNGESFELSEKVELVDDRSFVPLRNVSELFGKYVLWRDNGVILISDNDCESAFNDDIAKVVAGNLGKIKLK